MSDIVERLRTDVLWHERRGNETIAADCREAADEITRLRSEAANLRTVMVAAAEEIAAHWDAHCDAEGYGPVNLQRRLEEGIPSEYGYTAGAFAELKAERDRLRAALAAAPAAQQAEPTQAQKLAGARAWMEAVADPDMAPTDKVAHVYRAMGGAPAAPAGWQLVPVEPTKAMLDTAGPGTYWIAEARKTYRAMLAAAPTHTDSAAPGAPQGDS